MTTIKVIDKNSQSSRLQRPSDFTESLTHVLPPRWQPPQASFLSSKSRIRTSHCPVLPARTFPFVLHTYLPRSDRTQVSKACFSDLSFNPVSSSNRSSIRCAWRSLHFSACSLSIDSFNCSIVIPSRALGRFFRTS